MEARISLITLGVADLQRSIAFYRDGLKLPKRDEGSENIAFFETSGTWLSLYPREALAEDTGIPSEAAGSRDFTLAHNVHSPEEVDRILEGGGRRGRHPRQTRGARYSGVVTRDTSPTPTASCGRWPGTPISGLNNLPPATGDATPQANRRLRPGRAERRHRPIPACGPGRFAGPRTGCPAVPQRRTRPHRADHAPSHWCAEIGCRLY